MPDSTEETVLRVGEVVRVRSAEDILATLEADGTVRRLPLMPETLKYAGQELRVFKSAHKTCDTINHLGTTRKVDRAVHLVGARCDGSAHGGCQAGCLLFFKEEWLERVDGSPVRSDEPAPQRPGATMATVTEGTTVTTPVTTPQDAEPVYRCQATELVRASEYLPVHDMRQYAADVRSRNVSLWGVVKSLTISVFNNVQKLSRKLPRRLRIKGGAFYPFYRGTGPAKSAPRGSEQLKPGDLVEVRGKDEIMATLGPNNRNRGLWFDAEMLPYCGTRGRVHKLVDEIVDETTGKMLKLRDCVVIENVNCAGQFNRHCPRTDFIYWRTAWLRKLEDAPQTTEPAETEPASVKAG